ncbi:MAG: Bug family tripartite tricarboxylate transporter substrate binding protein [Pigmentiphaga sp.]|uniref:Bug family tripartite tricarboxylate transporter substrate binding protein n=1 Tax=Pigmentiphaga sp. TaxID=1977564 RepID=UPI003B53A914
MKALLPKSLLAACALVLSANAAASDFPSKPIRVVIPFPPGGVVDTIIRSIGPGLARELGQPVIVDNRPGGGAQIAASAIKQSPADGYTVFAGEMGALAINPTLYKNISYNPATDFEPVAALLKAPLVLYGNPAGKIRSEQTLRSALAGSTDVNYASMGPGTGPHILGHLLSRNNPRARLTHIPYKGAPAATMAVLSNEVDINFDAVPTVLNLYRASKVVPLGIAADKRSPFFPDVPTMAELGQPGVVMDIWVGVEVKRGTPPAVVAKLANAFNKAMDDPGVLSKFTELGYDRFHMSREDFGQFIKTEIDRYRPIIIESGASVE